LLIPETGHVGIQFGPRDRGSLLTVALLWDLREKYSDKFLCTDPGIYRPALDLVAPKVVEALLNKKDKWLREIFSTVEKAKNYLLVPCILLNLIPGGPYGII